MELLKGGQSEAVALGRRAPDKSEAEAVLERSGACLLAGRGVHVSAGRVLDGPLRAGVRRTRPSPCHGVRVGAPRFQKSNESDNQTDDWNSVRFERAAWIIGVLNIHQHRFHDARHGTPRPTEDLVRTATWPGGASCYVKRVCAPVLGRRSVGTFLHGWRRSISDEQVRSFGRSIEVKGVGRRPLSTEPLRRRSLQEKARCTNVPMILDDSLWH